MPTGDTIIQDRQSAEGYDLQARQTGWFCPEVVFGLAYEYVSPGETLLDLGIGSGLSSVPFHQAGLRVYGLDGSHEVLEVCAAKGFTTDLRQHDLRDLPFPYPSAFFDHVICVGVLNSFGELNPIFREVARLLKPGGIYAFTVEEQRPSQPEAYAINREAVDKKPQDDQAVTLFRHSQATITHLIDLEGFTLLKALEFLAFKYPAEHRDVYFKAYVTQFPIPGR
jgi:predicted TPR repeat methyltransferase